MSAAQAEDCVQQLRPARATRQRKQAGRTALLRGLEERLGLLSRTLSEANVAEKSLEIVKEIKELHSILAAVRSPEAAAPQRVVVVWGGPDNTGASASGPGRLAGSKPVGTQD